MVERFITEVINTITEVIKSEKLDLVINLEKKDFIINLLEFAQEYVELFQYVDQQEMI